MNLEIHSKIGLQQSSNRARWISIGLVSVMAIGMGGCASSPSSTQSAAPQAQSSPAATKDELKVVTTFLPITQFTKAVAGDRAEVTQLLPTQIEPHDYQAKPEDIQKLANADVLVENGLEMEEFLDDLVKNSGNSKLSIIDSSQGVPTISTAAIAGHEHEAIENQAEAKHAYGESNPHIWLDPKRAIRQVENIRDGLIATDPTGKEIYTANAAAYIQKLKALDAETTKMLQPYAEKTFVAFHDFAPYFAQSYRLKVTFLVDVPEGNPAPGDVKRVMDTVKATHLKTLLTEPQEGTDAFSALAKDLKVQISTFDPMETGGSDATEPDYYFTTMRQNVKALVSAFTGQSIQSLLPASRSGAIVPLPVIHYQFEVSSRLMWRKGDAASRL
jgi:zinc/manganese transport system substrate-binding protein